VIDSVQNYIEKQHLANSGTPILVACSGGVDSMVLCEILIACNFKIGIAHCNFGLRGADSEKDEEFVTEYAIKSKIPFFIKNFDTNTYKSTHQISTQMAARELRYEWFEEIRKQNNFHCIATAHHLDDQIETILLNLAKGTGIAGLRGMLPKSNFIIRPMLEVPKKEILQFASTHQINFREDSSNAKDDYQRNKIRHHILPILAELNPSIDNTLTKFIDRIRDYELLSDEYISKLKSKYCSVKNGIIEIKMGFIQSHKAGKTILYHCLNDFDFNSAQIEDVFNSKDSGKQFFSSTHRIVKDRNSIFIIPNSVSKNEYLIYSEIPSKIIFNNYKAICTIVPIAELNMKTAEKYAYFDMAKIDFPILIRYFKEGDYFYPMGMAKQNSGKVGKKKVSKYFKDKKFTLLEKENTPILFSNEKLMWVMGSRVDDRFKITSSTTSVLKIQIVDTTLKH
jgi:tRNA(Ile)-lysidine synthase